MLKLLHKEFLEKEHNELVYLNNILNVILII